MIVSDSKFHRYNDDNYISLYKNIYNLSDVFDVVRDANSQVYLLDFTPYSEKYCDSLAFEWSELFDDVN